MEEETSKVEKFIQDKISSIVMKENIQINSTKANESKIDPTNEVQGKLHD